MTLTFYFNTARIFKIPIKFPLKALVAGNRKRYSYDIKCSHRTNLKLDHSFIEALDTRFPQITKDSRADIDTNA